MDEPEQLVKLFESHRSRPRAVAYRMLGSVSEADDAVQEAWLRLSRSDAGAIQNLGGWLTTVVARVCLDMLRSPYSRDSSAGAMGRGGTAFDRLPQQSGLRRVGAWIGRRSARKLKTESAVKPLAHSCGRMRIPGECEHQFRPNGSPQV
jgi:DNA-directed RNA polymerase specialized sigma24 family protein